MVDSMKQSFLLKSEVLTPNRNGFMAKKRKWHLKAGSTVQLSLHKEPPEVGLVKKLTGSLY